MPSFFVATTFLGEPCGCGLSQGVNPEMSLRLEAADSAVRRIFEALPRNRRTNPATGRANASFREWCGVSGPHVCWLPASGHHSTGSAIDINVATNAYIVTRNGRVPGGEPGGETFVDMRNRVLAVYDRAVKVLTPPLEAADVGARRPNESTHSVWSRFKAVSDALAAYLRLVVDPRPTSVSRVAIENAEAVSDEDLLATIPESERLPRDRAQKQIEALLSSREFQETHPDWPNDARAQYLRILRDYEEVRIPMVIGEPSRSPARTRNPARGFLNLRSEIVTALCDQGLRWGACDFEVGADGASENGAMMHFDLADHGGYPEVPSLLRFG